MFFDDRERPIAQILLSLPCHTRTYSPVHADQRLAPPRPHGIFALDANGSPNETRGWSIRTLNWSECVPEFPRCNVLLGEVVPCVEAVQRVAPFLAEERFSKHDCSFRDVQSRVNFRDREGRNHREPLSLLRGSSVIPTRGGEMMSVRMRLGIRRATCELRARSGGVGIPKSEGPRMLLTRRYVAVTARFAFRAS